MTELPFSQVVSAILNLSSAISEFGKSILSMLGIPETIEIGSYSLNTVAIFSIILLVATFYTLMEVSGKLFRLILIGIICLFVLTLISSVI